MASGIDWFRWHHGSVTDPKFQLVSKKSGSTLPDVLAVWAYLLEKASAAEFRGCFGDVDCESIDCLFGFDDGLTESIIFQMVERKLIADEYIVAWEKRQPKKEDVTAADRKRRQRERDNELEIKNTVTENESLHVTPCHDREEESREEVNQEPRKPARKKPTSIPADFYPNENGVAYAEEKRISLAVELESFRNWHQAKGGAFKDWQACWRTWCDKAVEFGRAGKVQAAQINGQPALPEFMRGAI